MKFNRLLVCLAPIWLLVSSVLIPSVRAAKDPVVTWNQANPARPQLLPFTKYATSSIASTNSTGKKIWSVSGSCTLQNGKVTTKATGFCKIKLVVQAKGTFGAKSFSKSMKIIPSPPPATTTTTTRFVNGYTIEPDADLTGAKLKGANLSGADLRRANLKDADLSGATLTDADLSGANLWKANLESADLRRANPSNAVLTFANLSYAKLFDAKMFGADLSYVNLRGADLRRANLSGASLWKANLESADLTGADLTGAYLCDAIMTLGTFKGNGCP